MVHIKITIDNKIKVLKFLTSVYKILNYSEATIT